MARAAKSPATTAPKAADEAVVEEVVEAPEAEAEEVMAVEPTTFVEVQAEKPFGDDPEDLAGEDGDDVEAEIEALTAPNPEGASATYVGIKGEDRFHQGTITVIVPDPPKGYEEMVTTGRTYTLHRGKAAWVEKAHAKWLAGHPVYDIEVKST